MLQSQSFILLSIIIYMYQSYSCLAKEITVGWKAKKKFAPYLEKTDRRSYWQLFNTKFS